MTQSTKPTLEHCLKLWDVGNHPEKLQIIIDAAKRFLAIKNAVEGGESALVPTKLTGAMARAGAHYEHHFPAQTGPSYVSLERAWPHMLKAHGIDKLIAGD